MYRWCPKSLVSTPTFVFRLLSSKSGNSLVELDDVLADVFEQQTPNNLLEASKSVISSFSVPENRKRVASSLATLCGVRHENLANAMKVYSMNRNAAHEIQNASRPVHYDILRNIANLRNGIQTVCELRAFLLSVMRTEKDKNLVSSLLRLEDSTRELLTTWFCLSNLQLNRLTWESPGDILQKVASYEAVHPVRGLLDFRKRLGVNRRCFYFSHPALHREPLVMVHVALESEISSSVQTIMHEATLSENDANGIKPSAAIYYSITSTQKGLAGIDLGNMLIKQVAAQIQAEVPSVTTHSTLSPIPGFRHWLLRALHGHSEFGNVVCETTISLLSKVVGRDLSDEEATQLLIKAFSNDRLTIEQLESLKDVLLHLCAKYLYLAKKNKYALNAVANFHLRNGAELYRLNWKGDTSHRGIANSFGIMVNYRYYLDRVLDNSDNYIRDGVVKVDEQVLDCLEN